jgi:hypothetical protein
MPIAAPQTDRQDVQIIEFSNSRGEVDGGVFTKSNWPYQS